MRKPVISEKRFAYVRFTLRRFANGVYGRVWQHHHPHHVPYLHASPVARRTLKFSFQE